MLRMILFNGFSLEIMDFWSDLASTATYHCSMCTVDTVTNYNFQSYVVIEKSNINQEQDYKVRCLARGKNLGPDITQLNNKTKCFHNTVDKLEALGGQMYQLMLTILSEVDMFVTI